jgi:type IV pilus assembly protein PilA
MKSVQKGFTLIELMIVVAIIGILAAIAIPAYQDYTIRAQVTEGLNLIDGVKVAVADYYTQNGTFPAAALITAAPSGLGFSAPATGKYSTVDLPATGGIIQATYHGPLGTPAMQANAKLEGLKVAVTAYVSSNGDLIWQCGMSAAPSTNLGSTTAINSAAATNTTIVAKWLPASCK